HDAGELLNVGLAEGEWRLRLAAISVADINRVADRRLRRERVEMQIGRSVLLIGAAAETSEERAREDKERETRRTPKTHDCPRPATPFGRSYSRASFVEDWLGSPVGPCLEARNQSLRRPLP